MKTLSATLALISTLTSLAVASQAEAYEIRHSGTINGYQVESVAESPTRGQPDMINIWGPNGLENIVVTCSPFDWKSSGPNTHNFVDSVARSWCF